MQWVECVDVDAICLCVEERFGCVWMMGEVWVGVNGGRDVWVVGRDVWVVGRGEGGGERCGCVDDGGEVWMQCSTVRIM